MKKFIVYLPCIYSEMYQCEAENAKEAIRIVRAGDVAACRGEVVTGKESQGIRAVEVEDEKTK